LLLQRLEELLRYLAEAYREMFQLVLVVVKRMASELLE
jgi:hypothetical protein